MGMNSMSVKVLTLNVGSKSNCILFECKFQFDYLGELRKYILANCTFIFYTFEYSFMRQFISISFCGSGGLVAASGLY